MPASGIEEAIQLNVQAALRHWGVATKVLTALPAEAALVAGTDVHITSMEKELYTKAEAARSTALKLLVGEQGSSMSAETVLDRESSKKALRPKHPTRKVKSLGRKLILMPTSAARKGKIKN
eukprot:6492650-Amphidinium_carterae.2